MLNLQMKRGKVIYRRSWWSGLFSWVIAAESTLPVIGVPIPSISLNGLYSILAICQMPGRIPIATMATGKAGTKNAVLLPVKFLVFQMRLYLQSCLNTKKIWLKK